MNKYAWTVVSNLLLVGVLILIFSNVYDTNTTKILAAIMLAYLAILNTTSALAQQAGSTALASLRMTGNGNVGIASTSPWRTLSVTGTVGFDGLTGSTGAGSLCLDSNKQVVYNSASDNCLSSTRATKHDILDLDRDSLSLVEQLQPVSFVYNEGDGRVRYGFIAEDTAHVDAHLATYDASGTVSGIDDRSIIAILVGAVKKIWEKVAALIQSDEEQDAEIAELKARVSELETAAAGTPAQGGSGGVPDGPSAPMETSADAEDIATPSDGAPITSSASTTSNTREAANDNDPVAAEESAPEAQEATPEPASEAVAEPVPAQEIPLPEPANDNPPPTDLPATGTD